MIWLEMVSAGALLLGLFQEKPKAIAFSLVTLTFAVWAATFIKWNTSLTQGGTK